MYYVYDQVNEREQDSKFDYFIHYPIFTSFLWLFLYWLIPVFNPILKQNMRGTLPRVIVS